MNQTMKTALIRALIISFGSAGIVFCTVGAVEGFVPALWGGGAAFFSNFIIRWLGEGAVDTSNLLQRQTDEAKAVRRSRRVPPVG